MTPDALREQWRARGASAPLRAEMTFDGDALVLGAGAILAKVATAGQRTDDATSPDDARLAALLSAAHRRPLPPRALTYIRRAIVKKREGETVLALIHLALSGVAKLARPAEDARWLFVADAMMKEGIAPSVVIDVFGRFAGTLEELERRYNPDEPRVPAGSSIFSGRWTDGEGGWRLVKYFPNADRSYTAQSRPESALPDRR